MLKMLFSLVCMYLTIKLFLKPENEAVYICVVTRVAPDFIFGHGPSRNPAIFSNLAISGPGQIWPPDLRPHLAICTFYSLV